MKPTLLLLLTAALAHLRAAEPKIYEVHGVVRELRLEDRKLVVRHDEIPGYMEAMVMPFAVREPQLFTRVQPGDNVIFRLHVTDKEDWIDALEVTAHAILPQPATDVPSLESLKPGDPLPDFAFTDSRGQPVCLADYRGCAFAYTFLFTRCPFPKMCPLLSEKFAKVQTLLGDADAQLLSISIDPAHDTPEALAAYAARYHAQPDHWRIATGSPRGITALALRSGANFWEEKGVITHNLRTVVVAPDGKVRRIFTDNDWTPEQLVGELMPSNVN